MFSERAEAKYIAAAVHDHDIDHLNCREKKNARQLLLSEMLGKFHI